MKTWVYIFIISGFFWAPVGYVICALLTAGKMADLCAQCVNKSVDN